MTKVEVEAMRDRSALCDELRNVLSPEAVAVLCAHLRSAPSSDISGVDEEIRWFREKLEVMLADQEKAVQRGRLLERMKLWSGGRGDEAWDDVPF